MFREEKTVLIKLVLFLFFLPKGQLKKHSTTVKVWYLEEVALDTGCIGDTLVVNTHA